MKDKELKHLSRSELLELLIVQIEENEKLKKRIVSMQTQLNDRRLVIEQAGSIAEAAMQLSGIFDTAQQVAEHYLENIKRLESEAVAYSQKVQSNPDLYLKQVMKENDSI